MEAAKAEESPALLRDLSIHMLRLFSRCLLSVSTISSHPLFSILAAASLLAALYLPRPLLLLLLSPVPISTFLLLTALLRLGSPPPKPPVAAAATDNDERLTPLRQEPKPESKIESVGRHQKLILCDWGSRTGPLEVIYEEYEGEEEQEDVAGGGSLECPRWLQYADLGSGRLEPFEFSYAESDTESDGGSPEAAEAERWSSPEDLQLRWEYEEEGDDMIEIELEEENLIEIDISGGR